MEDDAVMQSVPDAIYLLLLLLLLTYCLVRFYFEIYEYGHSTLKSLAFYFDNPIFMVNEILHFVVCTFYNELKCGGKLHFRGTIHCYLPQG